MGTFALRLDMRPTQAALRHLRDQAPHAVSRALNRSRDSARTVMVRAVAGDMKLLQKDVRDNVLTRDATPGRPIASISASLKRLPLIRFKATQFKAGVKATTSSRKLYPGTFIAKMPTGHVGVFKRREKARLHIDELRGPSIGHVFDKHAPAAMERGQEQLTKNLTSEFRRVLRQGARL